MAIFPLAGKSFKSVLVNIFCSVNLSYMFTEHLLINNTLPLWLICSYIIKSETCLYRISYFVELSFTIHCLETYITQLNFLSLFISFPLCLSIYHSQRTIHLNYSVPKCSPIFKKVIQFLY